VLCRFGSTLQGNQAHARGGEESIDAISSVLEWPSLDWTEGLQVKADADTGVGDTIDHKTGRSCRAETEPCIRYEWSLVPIGVEGAGHQPCGTGPRYLPCIVA
jgi:hypothetical protein